MSVSVVVPVYNERDNVERLFLQLAAVLNGLERPYEILFVNDGSTDGTTEILDQLAARDPRVKVLHFRRNYGQTAALDAGLHAASGEAIVTLDGDLQNDPTDIPKLLAKLDEGYDLVHGWREKRQDAFWHRRLPSLAANRLIAWVSGFPVRDLGCTLKAIRREIAQDLHLIGDMHRFIPILAHAQGARCAEIPTRHHPRRFGATKYGLNRIYRVLLDLLTVKFLIHYSVSPMRLFGGIGLFCLGSSLAMGLLTLALKTLAGMDMTGNPLLYLTFFLGTVSLQFFSLGMLGETQVRTYFAQSGTRPYAVRRTVNFEANVGNERVGPRRASARAA